MSCSAHSLGCEVPSILIYVCANLIVKCYFEPDCLPALLSHRNGGDLSFVLMQLMNKKPKIIARGVLPLEDIVYSLQPAVPFPLRVCSSVLYNLLLHFVTPLLVTFWLVRLRLYLIRLKSKILNLDLVKIPYVSPTEEISRYI